MTGAADVPLYVFFSEPFFFYYVNSTTMRAFVLVAPFPRQKRMIREGRDGAFMDICFPVTSKLYLLQQMV